MTETTRPHETPTESETADDESAARGMAISELTADELDKPELADKEPAGPDSNG